MVHGVLRGRDISVWDVGHTGLYKGRESTSKGEGY